MSHSRHPHSGRGTLHELDAAQVHALLRGHEAVLIDVREPGEFESERIPGALLFPLSGFDPACLPLDGTKRLIFQCGTGRRSAQAAQQLLEAGSAEATHLAGGITAWKAAGLPLTRIEASTGRVHRGHL